MIKEAKGTGATVLEATENAKKALGAPDDADVKIEVLQMPSKKILGLFGGKEAEVKASYEVKEAKKPAAKKENKSKKEDKPKAAPKADKQPKAEKEVKAEAPEAAEKTYTGAVTEMGAKAESYISSILKGMGVEDFKINLNEDEESIAIDLDCGAGYGYVIGRRGETLDSIQYLTRLVINKGKEDYKRVSINAGNYREKREDTLRELAKKQSARVKKYGRSVCLDPMNPYERRIIHTAVQEIEGVSSHSVGSESDRKVVITLAEGFKPTNPGSGRSGRGYNGGRKYNKPAQSSEKATRAPRSDFGGASLYGKIEPKNKQSEE